MKIAAFYPDNLPHSSLAYADNVIAQLEAAGHQVVRFKGNTLPRPVDLYWQPSAGRNGPAHVLRRAEAPVVVTFHGAANLSLTLVQCFGPSVKGVIRGIRSRVLTRFSWTVHRRTYDAVIAVSAYAKTEAARYLGIDSSRVSVIHHGVDHGTFNPSGVAGSESGYLFHVSSYQPKKNIERIIAAYRSVPLPEKPPLKVVSPGYPHGNAGDGVTISTAALTHSQIADLYRHALAFVFPSIHETFGMPIIEAMACGCPVITSTHPACAEIAGDAALLVDPASTDSIASAMQRVISDVRLRESLRERSLGRAAAFSWGKCAAEHVRVFQSLIAPGPPWLSP